MKTSPAPQDFFVAGGTLWREAPSYIVRPADEELFRLALAGEFCNILAARQMGKSSLMVRTAQRLHEAGVRAPIVDISILGSGISTPEAWFFGFIDELAMQLELELDVDAWWEAHANHNPVQRFNHFLREVVLSEIRSPVVVFVDEIDSALGMAFTDDFFAAIRAVYNARASQPVLHRLTFILLGVARPADLIRDRNRTPYNIGAHIHLSDFTLPELEPFQTVFEAVYLGQGREIVAWVLAWTNGQPYLTQKLCSALVSTSDERCSAESVAETVNRLFLSDEARKESNLRAIRDRIESSPQRTKMLQIYTRMLRGRVVLDEERSAAKTELKLTGLVRSDIGASGEPARLDVHNRIYRTVFDADWVRKNLPASRTSLAMALTSLLAVMALLFASYAFYRQQIQPALTFVEQFQTSNSPEVRLTSLARLWELDDRPNSQAYQLYASLTHPEKLSLFNDLSSPQNVAAELVTVIEATYQGNENTPEGNERLNAMNDVLGQIGAAGAPSLKTEIEFWLKGRQEANEKQNGRIAASFYDSAWAESVARGRPNTAARFDRALALVAVDDYALTLVAVEDYALALEDLQLVWEQSPERREAIAALIQGHAALAAYLRAQPALNPAILAVITPLPPTPSAEATRTQPPAETPSATAPALTPPALTLTPTGEQAPASTGLIAIGFGEGTRREIFLLNPLTRLMQQVTNNGAIDEAPSFSPDDSMLVYASERSQDGWELYGFDLVRGTEQQLTAFDGQARFPSWSPLRGDTRIVFEGRTFGEANMIDIWLLDTANWTLEQLTSSGADSRPRWSPDGSRIVFGRATQDTTQDGRITANDASDVFILHLATQQVENLTRTPGFNDFNFAWSPDGAWIAFTSVRQDANEDGAINLSDSRDLFLIRPDGSDERRLRLGDKAIFSPSWSPDGRFIVVLAVTEGGQNEIMRFDTTHENFTPLMNPGPYYHPQTANLP